VIEFNINNVNLITFYFTYLTYGAMFTIYLIYFSLPLAIAIEAYHYLKGGKIEIKGE